MTEDERSAKNKEANARVVANARAIDENEGGEATREQVGKFLRLAIERVLVVIGKLPTRSNN